MQRSGPIWGSRSQRLGAGDRERLAAGLCSDESDLEVSAFLYRVQTLLFVRAQMQKNDVGGRTSALMDVVRQPIHAPLYSPARAWFASPSPAEAEEADKEVLGEIFRMIFHDNVSIDDALQIVVREDPLRVKLMPAEAAEGAASTALPSGLRPSATGGKRTG